MGPRSPRMARFIIAGGKRRGVRVGQGGGRDGETISFAEGPPHGELVERAGLPVVLGGAVGERNGEGDGATLPLPLEGDDGRDEDGARGTASDGLLMELGAGRVVGAETLSCGPAGLTREERRRDDVVQGTETLSHNMERSHRVELARGVLQVEDVVPRLEENY